MQVFDNFVGWEEVAHFQSVNLRISGPDGMYFERTFNQEDSIYFDLTTISAPDGTYHWELRAAPILSEEVRDWLAYAQETGDEEVLRELRRSGHLPDRASVDSGAFTVVDGTVVNPDIAGTEEGTASPGYSFRSPSDLSPADFVHTDDVIIPAKACVGDDCVDGESFGSNTLRLKENNTRIEFTDTSNTFSFPTQDWTLVANDYVDGGGNYFTIRADSPSSSTPFKIDSLGPTSSFHIADTGNIGIGTSVPNLQTDIHIVDGDDAIIRLEQDTSLGYIEQKWDIVNSGNFFLSDATNGTFPFLIKPNAGNWTFFIDSDSDTGMGTTSPDAQLNIPRGGEMVTP